MFLLSLLLFLGTLIGGAVALTAVFASAHWRVALRNALINATVAVGCAYLLLANTLGVLTLVAFPGVLAAFIAAGSWSHARTLAGGDVPPRYVRLYPVSNVSLLLVVCLAGAALQRACAWREEAELEVSKLIDPIEVLNLAQNSPRARAYVDSYLARNRTKEIASRDLIQVCGSVLRLAESDGARATLPHPADRICRSSQTYNSTK